uniref:Uncharacterized protein n=1 Tax=Cacopsylla melanoneura TaxID=428564 RepID=A0A8D8TVV7_9HEMI
MASENCGGIIDLCPMSPISDPGLHHFFIHLLFCFYVSLLTSPFNSFPFLSLFVKDNLYSSFFSFTFFPFLFPSPLMDKTNPMELILSTFQMSVATCVLTVLFITLVTFFSSLFVLFFVRYFIITNSSSPSPFPRTCCIPFSKDMFYII